MISFSMNLVSSFTYYFRNPCIKLSHKFKDKTAKPKLNNLQTKGERVLSHTKLKVRQNFPKILNSLIRRWLVESQSLHLHWNASWIIISFHNNLDVGNWEDCHQPNRNHVKGRADFRETLMSRRHHLPPRRPAGLFHVLCIFV